jgi:two-component system, chemotaxis family, protein-glutamate methylesterase/glutaminase
MLRSMRIYSARSGALGEPWTPRAASRKGKGQERMAAIRVLVVDDSVVIRKVLSEALSADREIEVVGTAADGNIALSKIPLLRPDLITLDVEMPGLSGLETLIAIRKINAQLPVIMFSTLTERGAATTLEALSLGASDCVTKPQSSASVEQTRARIHSDLIPKVKELCRRKAQVTAPPRSVISKPKTPLSVKRSLSPTRVELLAIGASTGGPNALAVLLPALAKEFPVPVVIVQHMPPLFTRLLAERLDKRCALSIHEGAEGKVLLPGDVWIAPGDYHMKLAREGQTVRLTLNQEPPQNSCRPSVDVLFESVAELYGARTLAVVLTGMGSDGVRGAQLIREAGGQVLVQDEATSVVWGMPGQVAAAGLADGILPLEDIAPELERRVHRLASLGGTYRANAFAKEKPAGPAPVLAHTSQNTKQD